MENGGKFYFIYKEKKTKFRMMLHYHTLISDNKLFRFAVSILPGVPDHNNNKFSKVSKHQLNGKCGFFCQPLSYFFQMDSKFFFSFSSSVDPLDKRSMYVDRPPPYILKKR